jgi:hypothetical protein
MESIRGSRKDIKRTILDYCLDHFETEQIWIIDSLQVFDPYYLSRINAPRARLMLDSIRISRPFTFYQLKEKIYSLTKVPLNDRSTIIISSINCFDEDGDPKELGILKDAMNAALQRLSDITHCKMFFGEVNTWDEPWFQYATK